MGRSEKPTRSSYKRDSLKSRKAKTIDEESVRLIEECKEVLKNFEDMDFYEILGIESGVTKEEIRKAYQNLSKQYHPDRYPGQKFDRQVTQLITEIFTRLTDAYNILTDDEQRRLFDQRKQVYEEFEFKNTYKEALRYFKQQNFPEAIKRFRKTLEKEPTHKDCQIYVAWCRYKISNDPRSGQEDFRELLQQFPEDAQIYYFLGLISKAEKDFKEAYLFFKRATEINANYTEALRELRLMNMRSGPEEKESSSFFSKLLKKKIF